MVEDRITDGKRIAQLLASELTGLSGAPLDRLDVTDADRDAEPTPAGTFAYAIARDGERVGEVFVHESGARVDLSGGAVSDAGPDCAADVDGLSAATTDDGRLRLRVEYGAAVKRAVDCLVTVLFDE